MDVALLRWFVNGVDVTCENCHTAMYKPDKDQRLCPKCLYVLATQTR